MRMISFLLIGAAVLAESATSDALAPLWLYAGTWRVASKNAPQGRTDMLSNQCSALAKYFACGQTINGQPGGLIVFIPAGKPDAYYTQTIQPDGRATGRDDLQISGDQWTYSSRRDEGGKTTLFRNVNTFSGKSKIHFEQSHSTKGSEWVVDNSGDEVRVGAPPHH